MAVKKELIYKFAMEYATLNVHHPLDWWGKRYGVTKRAIQKWLKLNTVRDIIEKETISFGETVVKAAQKNVNLAMRELKKIIKSQKFTDVKRKACLDMFRIAKIETAKEDKTKDTNKNYSKISTKELNKEYDELLGNNRRKKKSTFSNQTSADDTLN